MLKSILNFIFIFLSTLLLGQNLVPNGSFEEYKICPEDFGTSYYLPYVSIWESPNLATPDYFNACSHKCGVPLNWVGNAEAYHGDAYMGVIACMQQIDRNQISYREYIRIELSDSLKQGHIYYAAMQVRLGLSCSMSCGGLGMHFSSSAMRSNQTYNYPVKAQVEYSDNKIIGEKETWTQICGTFEANGGEKYLIIGNFLSNQQMRFKELDENFIKTQTINPSAYYYIDDVQVYEYYDSLNLDCDAMEVKIPKAFKGSLEADTKMVLKNLYFEVDKAVILRESYFELDQLAFELKRKSNLKISIYGHTDNTGTSERNNELSAQRALAVRNYLLEKGVSKFRITTKGFGALQPIADNSTEEGKQLNRRVEIEVN